MGLFIESSLLFLECGGLELCVGSTPLFRLRNCDVKYDLRNMCNDVFLHICIIQFL
jgi:hypothetical protein